MLFCESCVSVRRKILLRSFANKLGETDSNRQRERARLVLEKPLGYDLESALHLNRALTNNVNESQIFRIDHYLGKETVQNILAFRCANPLLEPIWDRRYVDHVTITVGEEVGVKQRGAYYEKAAVVGHPRSTG